MRGIGLILAKSLAATAATVAMIAAPAWASSDLFVVLKLEKPALLSGELTFTRPASGVEFAVGAMALRKLMGEKACAADNKARKRCHLLETVARREANPCVAVLLDKAPPRIALKDIRVRRGKTEEDAVRKAFFGSNTYNGLYYGQRLLNPFRTVTIIDEFVFTDGESWADRYLGSTCRK